MKKLLFVMISVVFILLLTAGCSNSNNTGKSEEFQYAMSGLYKPFNFTEDGELTGFDVEIGQALADKMGMEPVPITNPWETIIQALLAEKYDAIIGSMSITEERLETVDFSNPYYRSGAQIFVATDNDTISSADDLKGKKIGVVKASIYLDHAMNLTDEDNVVQYDSDITALTDINTGRLDAVITDKMVGFQVMKEDAMEIKDVGELLSLDEQAIAVRKDDKDFLEKVNKALAEIIEDGTYDEISEKWFGRSILGN